MFIGVRVIRGPDWSRGESDGGEGHVGTVVMVEGASSVDVIWDSGQRSTCRAGKDGKHDLRIYDSGTVGIRHKDVKCAGCETTGIFGLRWTCTQCEDTTLCLPCYSADKHDIGHVFKRYDTPETDGIEVQERSSSLKIEASGLFPGARVVRGEDWKWANQDGGNGSKGTVTEIHHEAGASSTRNIVRVKWDNDFSNFYRVGHEGKMDLKYVEESLGPGYYRDHMPLLDVSSVNAARAVSTQLETGSKVCIQLEKEELKQVQADKGGWSAGLGNCIGKTGVIRSFPSEGIASVSFADCHYRIATSALIKVPEHTLNDTVRILSDIKKVKLLQDGHGDWNDKMEQALGKVGRVGRVDSDGDVVVAFGSTKWIFHPACCIPAPAERVDDVNSGGGGGEDEEASIDLSELQGPLMQLLGGLLNRQGLAEIAKAAAEGGGVGGTGVGSTLKAAELSQAITAGNLEGVQKLVQENPPLISTTVMNLTPLMVACHEGQLDITRFLLDNGADLESRGQKNATALAVALIGKRELVAELLIERGANVHVVIGKGQTTLHICAAHNEHRTMKLLIKKGCDVNAVDAEKDTPLHDAILGGSDDCVELLLGCADINLRLCNGKNFNPLHWASLRDRVFAVDKILERDPSLANLLMADNTFSALHIAAANDRIECGRLLIDKAKADVDRKGHEDLTPLHIACSQPNFRAAELLIQKGANTNDVTESGDTPLHVLCVHCSKQILESGPLSEIDENKYVRVACLLLDNKAYYDARNHLGVTALDLCQNAVVKTRIRKYIEQNKGSMKSASASTGSSRQAIGGLNALLDLSLPCARCVNRMSDVTLKPCDHKVVCRSCCAEVNTCPVCQTQVTERVVETETCKMQ